MPPQKKETRSLSYQLHKFTNVRAETAKALENCINVSEHWEREELLEKIAKYKKN